VRKDNSRIGWDTEIVKRKRGSETRVLSNMSDLGAAESCYCRPDLQVLATKYLTKCLYLGDPNIELLSAVNLYQENCTEKGLLRHLRACRRARLLMEER
jgi:hypothetical protein